jgi:hypothetical protein
VAAANLIFRETLIFAAEVMGDRIRAAAVPRSYNDKVEQRGVLRSWLFKLSPNLSVRPGVLAGLMPGKHLTVFSVMDALSALDAGETQDIFKPNTGKNRRANRWSLSRAKLDALAWKKRLVALGRTEKEANYEVMVAFKEQWDTIRKWKVQCEAALGEDHVHSELTFAGGPMDPYISQARNGMFGGAPNVAQGLSNAGKAYRHELSQSAKLSKRKGRAEPDE